MELFDVYPLYPIEPAKADGLYLWDQEGNRYLDFYGGHAVISIGHGHPHYKKRIKDQLDKIGFYSNSVINPVQQALAKKLGELSGYEEYKLFLCNSGAEANENALKLASFHNEKRRVISFHKGFHGRTSGAVSVTDNPKYISPFNSHHEVTLLDLNDLEGVEKEIGKGDVCAVIIEGIQGLAGIYFPDENFMTGLQKICNENNVVLILDEVQSGYGRSGKFFAHQHYGIEPDIITTAKGMGNGFPIAGVLIHPKFKPWYGMLGTTFGGNHLACAAGLAVLEVLEKENLIENASEMESIQKQLLKGTPHIKEIRCKGLMTGIEFEFPIKALRVKLLTEEHIFTGTSMNQNVLRLLPPLGVGINEIKLFAEKLNKVIEDETIHFSS